MRLTEDLLRDFGWSRVTEVPRPAPATTQDGLHADQGLAQRLGLISAAYHSALSSSRVPPIAFSWIRTARGGPVHILAGGGLERLGPSRSGSRRLAYPPGASGAALAGEDWSALTTCLRRWGRMRLRVDPLSRLSGGELQRGVRRPSIEESLLGAWTAPFAWLVVAEAVPLETIDDVCIALDRQISNFRFNQMESRASAVMAEQLEKRLAELRQSTSTGLWLTHVIVGADDGQQLAQVSGLLAAANDLLDLPYVLLPARRPESLDSTLVDETGDPAEEGSPTYGSSELLAVLARPPGQEVPGLRLTVRGDFDTNPEPPYTVRREPVITLGDVLDRQEVSAGPLSIGLQSLNRHAFVTGATGAGKSQTVRHMLEQLSGVGIPWLVIEPAKAEYSKMAGRLGASSRVFTLRIGDANQVAVGLNPLEPESGFRLQTHIDLVRALFLAAFEADEPFPQVLSAALARCYAKLGWDTVIGAYRPRIASKRPVYPNLADLQGAAREVVAGIGYGKEVTDNVRGFIDVRLSSLRMGTPGRFFEGGHALSLGALLSANAVVEFEDVGDNQDKAFLMGLLLIRIYERLRLDGESETLRHVTVVEEAHRLLRRPEGPSAAARAVQTFAEMLAEVRAYGEGIVVAEQIPAKLIPDVIKNSALKVVHRLPAQDDRDVVGATMNLTEEQSHYVVTLPPGRAAVFTDGMDYPVLVAMPDGTRREGREGAVGPQDLVTRSAAPGCPAGCQKGDRCTLRAIKAAENLVMGDERMIQWIEMITVGRLMGLPVLPGPEPELRAAWLRSDARTRDCAVAQAVDAVVRPRLPVIVYYHDSTELSVHLVGLLAGWLTDGVRPGIERFWCWQVGRFRWNHVEYMLDRQIHSQGAREAPPVVEWDDWLDGLPAEPLLSQPTVGAQRRAMEALRSGERGTEADVLIGDRDSPIVAAVRRSGGDAETVLDSLVAAPDRKIARRVVERMMGAVALPQ